MLSAPCYRYHCIVPVGAAPSMLTCRRQLLMLTAVAYRAMAQLQPKCDLSVAVPPLLTTLLGHTALKLGLPLGPAPPLQRC